MQAHVLSRRAGEGQNIRCAASATARHATLKTHLKTLQVVCFGGQRDGRDSGSGFWSEAERAGSSKAAAPADLACSGMPGGLQTVRFLNASRSPSRRAVA